MAILGIAALLVCLALGIGGIIQVAFGLRGKPMLSSPHCRQCKYDLRAASYMEGAPKICPECGLDLSQPDAVLFGSCQRRPRQVITGAAMLLAVPVLFVTVTYVSRIQSTATSAPSMSNQAIIARLPKTADEPWDWQELQRRLAAGKLSNSEVDSAFAALATNLQSIPGRRHHLAWSDNFLSDAIKAKAVSTPQLQSFLKTYFDDMPRVEMSVLGRQGKPIPAILMSDHAWGVAGHNGVFCLNRVECDGKALTVHSDSNVDNPDLRSGRWSSGSSLIRISGEVPPGEHDLVFIFDIGTVIESATLRGLNGLPGVPSKWPSPLATWQVKVTKKVRIAAPEEQLIKQLDATSGKVVSSNFMKIQQALIRPAQSGAQLVLNYTVPQSPAVPVAGRMVVLAGNRELPANPVLIRTMQESAHMEMNIESLPATVNKVTLRFVPDPTVAEDQVGFEEIWGQPLEWKDIPLERFDLEGR